MKRRKRVKFIQLILIFAALLIFGWLFKLNKEVNQVLKWQSTVEKATKKYHIEEQSDIVLAIIYTETKGEHIDIMQSSESRYGEQNIIETSEESIDSGVEHLAEVLNYAKKNNCDIWTGVQAYNFGLNYVDFIAKHSNQSSIELAEEYSRDVLAPLLGNTTQETYFYKSPLALLYNGGYLYKNGGNFLYSENVKWHLKLLRFFS